MKTLDINYVRWLQAERKKINDMDLSKVKFIEDGKEVKVSREVIKKFDFTGLNNIDFIMSNYYLTEE